MDFNTLKTTDLLWMDKVDIQNCILNTFESTIEYTSNDIIVIKSKWKFLNREDIIKRMFKDIIDNEYYIYFYIYTNSNNFLIIRSLDSSEEIDETINNAKLKSKYEIFNRKEDYTNGNQFSTIIDRENIPYLYYSTGYLIKDDKLVEVVCENNEYHMLDSTRMDCDLIIDDQKMSKISDLIIGTTINIKNLKKL